MSNRKLLYRDIKNGRMLKNNGSWMYCSECNNTVAYLCYSTYHNFKFESNCLCGNTSSFHLGYEETLNEIISTDLKLIKNRFCCAEDDAPFFSVVSKNIESYKCTVTCNKCNRSYTVKEELL